MGVITTTFGLTSKASGTSPAADAGPLSVALSLSTTDSLSITEVQSKILDMVSLTHQLVWDASDFTSSGAAGVDGAFLYFKNKLVDNNPADILHSIMISTSNADVDGGGEAARLMTLRPGEFCWMPWDCTQDIYADPLDDGVTNVGALECWLFVRTGTA